MKCARESCSHELGFVRYVLPRPRRDYCSKRCYMADIRDIETGDLSLYKHPIFKKAALLFFLIGSPATALEPGKVVVLTKGLACDTAPQLLDVVSGAKVSQAKYLEKLAIYARMSGHGGVACGITENVRMMVVEIIGTTTLHDGQDYYLVHAVTTGGVSLFTALSVEKPDEPEEAAL